MATFRVVRYDGHDVSVPVPEYEYTAFDPSVRQFRLFVLHPNADSDAPIRGAIEHHDLNDHPAYTALSYEWGDPSVVDWITIGSTNFPVTENLANALRTLRSKRCPLVWIDAICIDQSNEVEKAEHIPIMTEIYHEAESVCAWIGPEKEGSEKVMDILRAIHVSRKAAVAKTPWSPDEAIINRYYSQLQKFFDRTYWRRVWIIQELSVASQIYILCGSRIVQWAGFELFILRLQGMLDVWLRMVQASATFQEWRTQRPEKSRLENSVALCMQSPAFKHVTRILLSRSNRLEGRPVGLLENLSDTVQSKATDPRDKVFALLGLGFDGANFVKKPSYVGTNTEVALEMTKSFVFARKSLDIIFVPSSSPLNLLESERPSWCPDYLNLGTTMGTSKLCAYLTGHDDRHRLGVKSKRWRATGDGVVSRHAIRVEQNRLLVTRGKRICSIVSIGPSLDSVCPMELRDQGQIQKEQDNELTAMAINEALILYAKDYSTQSQSPRILRYLFHFDDSLRYNSRQARDLRRRMQLVVKWRSLNKFLVIGKRSLGETGKSFAISLLAPDTVNWPFVEEMTAALTDGIITGFLGDKNTSSWSSSKSKDRLIQSELVEALESLQDLISEDMRFISTIEDFHVGWAQRNAKPGDEIFLLAGCSMPAVLRRCNQHPLQYKIVGHALLDKLMDGSFWNSLSNFDLEEIQLL